MEGVKCDSCDYVFEVYGAYAEEIKRCPVCGSYSIWLVEPMMIQEEVNMNQLIKMQKGITEAVGKRIKVLEDEGLALPEQYSAKNALSSAFFTLQKVYGIEKATQESIA